MCSNVAVGPRQDCLNENWREIQAPKEENLSEGGSTGLVKRKEDTKKKDNPKSRTRKDENTKRNHLKQKEQRTKLNITSLFSCPLQPRHETPPNNSSQRMQGLIVLDFVFRVLCVPAYLWIVGLSQDSEIALIALPGAVLMCCTTCLVSLVSCSTHIVWCVLSSVTWCKQFYYNEAVWCKQYVRT